MVLVGMLTLAWWYSTATTTTTTTTEVATGTAAATGTTTIDDAGVGTCAAAHEAATDRKLSLPPCWGGGGALAGVRRRVGCGRDGRHGGGAAR